MFACNKTGFLAVRSISSTSLTSTSYSQQSTTDYDWVALENDKYGRFKAWMNINDYEVKRPTILQLKYKMT